MTDERMIDRQEKEKKKVERVGRDAKRWEENRSVWTELEKMYRDGKKVDWYGKRRKKKAERVGRGAQRW